jgi:Phage integrase family
MPLRSTEKDFAHQVDVVVFADLGDAVAIEEEVEMVAISVLLAIAGDGVGFCLDGDVGTLRDDGQQLHVEAVGEHRDEEALEGLGERPFWNGSGTIKTFMGNWQRTLVMGSAHKFRHTFSVNLLTRGVSIEDVAILLGHNSIRITERAIIRRL